MPTRDTIRRSSDTRTVPLNIWDRDVITDADTLVFANGYHVDATFEEMLKEAGSHYHLIGDGEKVGNLKDAITRAYEVVKNI